MKKKIYNTISILGIFALTCISGYSSNLTSKNQTIKDHTETYKSLFPDNSYNNGFDVSTTKEGIAALHGVLNYGGSVKGKPFWRIAQWNCYNNDIVSANYSFVNNMHNYSVGSIGNRITVDTKNNILVLELNASTEYGKNGITTNPRKNYESWPTLLIDHEWTYDDCLKIADKSEIRMNIDYKVLKVIDKMPAGATNTTLHAAQFQWYITIQNRNTLSEDYGHFIWFGLSFYDNRHEYSPYYAAQDGGKESNTGAFIYTPDMKLILSSQGKAEVGKKFSVNADILPIMKEAFALAQKRNYLTSSKWTDMYIGGTNIGWEVPGTYDVSVEISKLNITYR